MFFNDFEYSVEDGEVVILANTGDNGDLIIPSTIDGLPVTAIDRFAFAGWEEELKSIFIPASVTFIDCDAFEDCYNVIVYAETDRQPKGWDQYSGLNGHTIHWGAKISGDFIYSTNFGKAKVLRYLGNDEHLIIPKTFDGAPVTTIVERAFLDAKCSSIVLPDTLSAIEKDAFFFCDTCIYNEFDNGFYLPSSNNPFFAFIKTTDIRIDSCVVHPETTLIASFAFHSQLQLNSLFIPSSVKYVSEFAFMYCPEELLISVEAPAKPLGWATFWNPDENKVEWGKSLTEHANLAKHGDFYYSKVKDGISIFRYLGNAVQLTIPKKIENTPIVEIAADAFSGNKTLSFLSLPDCILNIGERAFSACQKLKHVSLPKTLENLPIMAFYNCEELESIDMPSIKTLAYGAFMGCKKLNRISLPNGLTEIGIKCFCDCHSIEQISIPDSTIKVQSLAFENCLNLKKVDLPDTLVHFSRNSFENCPLLPTAKYSSGIYLGTPTNPYYMLLQTESREITECELHPDTKILAGEVFVACYNLTLVILNYGLRAIGERAFAGCFALENILIPASVERVGKSIFYDCNRLTAYCDFPSAPEGWHKYWSGDDCKVEWNN